MKNNMLKVFLLVVLLFSVSSLSAAVSVVEMFINGGVFMYIISFLLVIMLILAIIKYWQLSIKERLNTQQF